MSDDPDRHRFEVGRHASLGEEAFAERAAAKERDETRHDAACDHHRAGAVDQCCVSGDAAEHGAEPGALDSRLAQYEAAGATTLVAIPAGDKQAAIRALAEATTVATGV